MRYEPPETDVIQRAFWSSSSSRRTCSAPRANDAERIPPPLTVIAKRSSRARQCGRPSVIGAADAAAPRVSHTAGDEPLLGVPQVRLIPGGRCSERPSDDTIQSPDRAAKSNLAFDARASSSVRSLEIVAWCTTPRSRTSSRIAAANAIATETRAASRCQPRRRFQIRIPVQTAAAVANTMLQNVSDEPRRPEMLIP